MAVQVLAEPKRRLFNIKEYMRIVDAGILTKYDRVELIKGEIVEMSPIGDRHAAFLANLMRMLVLALGNRAHVSQSRAVVAISNGERWLAVIAFPQRCCLRWRSMSERSFRSRSSNASSSAASR